MDFIKGLPPSKGKNTILVVVNRLTKYGHFLTLSHHYTVATVAYEFLCQVYKLHGASESIVSDRDKVYVSTFWHELFKHMGVRLQLFTAYHPQMDGQTEVLNRCLEGYFRYMNGEKPHDWLSWIPLAKWWYIPPTTLPS